MEARVQHGQEYGFFREDLLQLSVAHEIEVGIVSVKGLRAAVRAPLGNGGEQLQETLDDGASDTSARVTRLAHSKR